MTIIFPLWVATGLTWLALVLLVLIICVSIVYLAKKAMSLLGFYWLFIFFLTCRKQGPKEWGVMQMMFLRDKLEEESPDTFQAMKEVWK